MKRDHESRPKRLSEPVQVYLSHVDRDRLDRLVERLDATKSDVLRRAIEALEHQVSNPADHPALQLIGLADGAETSGLGYDVAREHDRFLAESEMESWAAPRKPSGKSSRRGR